MHEEHLIIGTRTSWGSDAAPFGVQHADRRHHLYVIGKTGSGKSTMLRNLILQHLARGDGVGLIDPHGDLAEELLDHIPRWRTDHVVYFNSADFEHPISFNPLANVPQPERHRVASGLVSTFKGIWRDSWGPRLEYILYNALATLLDCDNTSLLGVMRLLTDPVYRQWAVKQVHDPFIRAFWTGEYEQYDERFRREAIAPIQNKLGQFLLNAPMRNILGQAKNRIDFRFLMDTQRIFIANLSKGRIGEDKANLLGSLLTAQFQFAALGRANVPEGERRDFFLFIDEFHNFTTDAFATILSEARKYRLCLTLSHQYIDQLTPEIRQAVFGNVGTILSFRVGFTDAEVLAKEFGDVYPPQQFSDLDQYEVMARVLRNGIQTEPFWGKTLPPLDNGTYRRENLIRRSRERFTAPRAEVEERIRCWAGESRPEHSSNHARSRIPF